jgi:excinuclease UvrABC nuclease subunit
VVQWVGPLVLCAEEIGRVPGGIGGVYVLQRFDGGRGLYPPFYVGKSTDLRARLIQHFATCSTSPDIIVARTNGRAYFSAAPVADVDERAAVEAALIQLLRPPCNRQVPRTAPLYPTLPPIALWP